MSTIDDNTKPHEFSIETDFETYEVPPERAQQLREELKAIKNNAWLGDLFAWVKETGEDFQNVEQGDLIDSAPAKRLIWLAEHPLANLQLILEGSDLEISVGGAKFVILQQLPKADDLLVSYYDSQVKQDFEKIEALFHEELKAFTRAKSERNKQLQEKLMQRKIARPEQTEP